MTRRLPGLLCLLIVFLLLLPLAACQAGPAERFPSVTTLPSASAPAQGTSPADNPASRAITLRVAAPITAEAAEALRQLYLAFQGGLLTRDSQSLIGDRFVPGDALASDHSLSFRFEFVPLDTVQDGRAWGTLTGKGALPDVFVSGDIGSLARKNALMDLSSLVDRLDIAAAARLPLFAVEAVKRDGKVLGIPFLASVPMLIWNPDLLQRLGIEMPASLDADGLLGLLRQTTARLAHEATLPEGLRTSTIADIRPLLSVWPAALDSGLTCAGWQNGNFHFEHAGVRSVLQLLRGLDSPQTMPGGSVAAAGAWNEDSARELFLSGQSIFLIDDSANLPGLLQQSRVPVKCLPLPSSGFKSSLASLATPVAASTPTPGSTPIAVSKPTAGSTPTTGSKPTAGSAPTTGSTSAVGSTPTATPVSFAIPIESGRQAFQVTAWCVSAQTAYPAEAARLALFLAQDPDALLLLNRYSQQEGMLPLTHANAVWERTVGRQSQSKVLLTLANRLNQGFACPSIQLPAFNAVAGATLLSADLFRADHTNAEADLSTLSRTADDRLKRAAP